MIAAEDRPAANACTRLMTPNCSAASWCAADSLRSWVSLCACHAAMKSPGCDGYPAASFSSRSWLSDLRVALAVERLHHLAHEEAALLLADLVVAGAVLGDGVGVGGEDVVDDRAELAGVAHLRQPALVDDLLRSLRLGEALAEHVLGLAARDQPVGDQADELGQAVGRERQHRGRQPGLVEVPEHVAVRTSSRRRCAVPPSSASTAASA